MTQSENLRASAKTGMIWGVGFTLARDMIQFLAMLVMVRLLSPAIYGQQALALTIIGFLAVASLKALAKYPLAARDPREFDWDTQFTAGAVVNTLIFLATIVVGVLIMVVGDANIGPIGLVVTAMSPVFIVEIAATHHLTYLQAHHQWQRMRTLLILGTILGTVAGIVLAWMGFGVFALASTTVLFPVPLALDLMLSANQRPRFALARLRKYADGAKFGLNRATSNAGAVTCALVENSALTGFFGFAALGSFSRAIGLAQITSGRIGPVAIGTLYSILTRAEAASERFQRFAALLLQGVVWLTIPASAFLSIEAPEVVRLLYGARWDSVTPLLPLAATIVALRGVTVTINQTMLANLQTRECLRLDLAGTFVGLLAILVIPMGVVAYLLALVACEISILAASIHLAARGGAISLRALVGLALPCLAATTLASLTIAVTPGISADNAPLGWLVAGLSLNALLFGAVYAVVLRYCAPIAFVDLLDALPIPSVVRRTFSWFLPSPCQLSKAQQSPMLLKPPKHGRS